MVAWLGFLFPVTTALAIVAALGLPIAWVLRARGFAVALITVPAAFAVMGLSSFVAPMVGMQWTILAPLALTAVLTAVLLVVRRYAAIERSESSRRAPNLGLWLPVSAAAIGGVVIAASVAVAIKTPDAISQTYDVNFHLNAVRMILDKGSASPVDMDLSAPGYAVFYPALWHAFVALVVQISGVSIPLATNAVLFTVIAVVWTIGMVGFGRAVAGPSTRVTLISGVLCVAIPSFPLALTGYGVLYPNLLSIALLPYFIIGFMQFFGLAQARRSDGYSSTSAMLLMLGTVGAACLAHPNALHALLIWIIGPTLFITVRAFRGSLIPQRNGVLSAAKSYAWVRKSVSAAAIPVLAIAIFIAWLVGRTTDAPWGGNFGPRSAILEAIGMSPHAEGHNWALTILAVIGIYVVARNKHLRWLFIPGALFFALYVISDGFPPSEWRTFFLTPWYNTPWRLSALAWMGAFPFLVLGASAAWSALRGGLKRWTRVAPRPTLYWTIGCTLVVLFLIAAAQGTGTGSTIKYVNSQYNSRVGSAALLDTDERAVLERLSEHLPEDAKIINNPWNGGALAYAISGYQVLTPHAGGSYDPRYAELSSQLKEGTPRACELVEELDAHYILDFGTKYVFQPTKRAAPFLGVTDVEGSDMFTELDREGEAVLYEVTGCN